MTTLIVSELYIICINIHVSMFIYMYIYLSINVADISIIYVADK